MDKSSTSQMVFEYQGNLANVGDLMRVGFMVETKMNSNSAKLTMFISTKPGPVFSDGMIIVLLIQGSVVRLVTKVRVLVMAIVRVSNS